MKVNLITLAVFLIAMFLARREFIGVPWTIMRIVGASIAVPSFVLLGVARYQLGRSFSVLPRARVLVTSGLYSRLRNPIYIFSELGLAGMALLANKPWLLLGLVAIVPLQVYRSRREEEVLATRFGSEYDLYKRRTWF